jgi:hypothetical protein
MNMGKNSRGIFGCTPTDPLHAFEEGIVKNFLEVVVTKMTDSAKTCIDGQARDLLSNQTSNCSSRLMYPRICLTNGLSAMSFMSADERMGVLFGLSILMRTDACAQHFQNRVAQDFDSRKKRNASRSKPKKLASNSQPPFPEPEATQTETLPPLQPEPASDSKKKQARPRSNKTMYIDDAEHQAFILDQLSELDLDYINEILGRVGREQRVQAYLCVWDLTYKSFRVERPDDWYVLSKCPIWQAMLQEMNPLTSRPVPAGAHASSVLGENSLALVRKRKAEFSIDGTYEELLLLVDSLLCLHSCFKYDDAIYQDTAVLETSIRLTLSLLSSVCDRGNDSNGWSISKFHDLIHCAEDAQQFGSLRNIDTGQGERGLKYWAKAPAANSRKVSQDNFHSHVAQRMYERHVLSKAARVWNVASWKAEKVEVEPGKMDTVIWTATEDLRSWERTKSNKKGAFLKDHLENLMFEYEHQDRPTNVFKHMTINGCSVQGCTQLTTKGSWFDVAFLSEEDEHSGERIVPCRVHGFMEIKDVEYMIVEKAHFPDESNHFQPNFVSLSPFCKANFRYIGARQNCNVHVVPLSSIVSVGMGIIIEKHKPTSISTVVCTNRHYHWPSYMPKLVDRMSLCRVAEGVDSGNTVGDV